MKKIHEFFPCLTVLQAIALVGAQVLSSICRCDFAGSQSPGTAKFDAQKQLHMVAICLKHLESIKYIMLLVVNIFSGKVVVSVIPFAPCFLVSSRSISLCVFDGDLRP